MADTPANSLCTKHLACGPCLFVPGWRAKHHGPATCPDGMTAAKWLELHRPARPAGGLGQPPGPGATTAAGVAAAAPPRAAATSTRCPYATCAHCHEAAHCGFDGGPCDTPTDATKCRLNAPPAGGRSG